MTNQQFEEKIKKFSENLILLICIHGKRVVEHEEWEEIEKEAEELRDYL